MIAEGSDDVPLCVDLDGTLIKTDMLFESALLLLKVAPWSIFLFPIWLLRGKANLKAQIARRTDIADLSVPFNEDVVDFVRDSRGSRKTLLITGTNEELAKTLVQHLNVFDEVHGSTDDRNLVGEEKKTWILSRFSKGNFDYIGNEKSDIPVWKVAKNALVVSKPSGICKSSSVDFSKAFLLPESNWKDRLRLLRPHQWSKNALIFLPFLLEYRFTDLVAFSTIWVAFFAMSFLASATYIINDLLDLGADRQNSTKKNRVLASGVVSIPLGVKTMLQLFAITAVLMVFLPWQLDALLGCYLVFTLTYSFVLKQKAMLDVISIAALHTMRIVAGTVAIQAQWSFWLLAFSMFLFFSLATAKRVTELVNLRATKRNHTIGRDYFVQDIPVLVAAGVSTGFISVLVVALYINSDKVQSLYANPMALWFLCPVLMYWIGRIWLITSRGGLHEDPIVFAFKDKTSLYTVAILSTTLLGAMFMDI